MDLCRWNRLGNHSARVAEVSVAAPQLQTTHIAMTTKFALIGCSIALWWISASAQAAGERPVIVGNPALVLDTQATSGSVAVDLRNDSDKPMLLHLAVSPAQDAGQGAALAIKGQPADAASFDLTIRPRESQRISIAVSAADAGDFDIDLLDAVDRVGRIPVRHKPFTVHLADPKAIVQLSDGKPTDITLANDDPISHRVNWRLRVDGQDVCTGPIVLASKSATPLTCTPKFGWGFLTSAGTVFRPLSSPDATLILEASGAAPPQPPLSIASLNVSSEYFSGPVQLGLNYSVLFLALAVGGVLSLLLSQIVPNRLSRLSLRERLDELDRTINGLGAHTDSSLRVLLRVELSRLYAVLNSRAAYSPEFVSVVGECSQGIERLKRRAMLVLQLETVLRSIRQAEATVQISWTQSRIARANARRAQELLRNAVPGEADFLAAQKAIADAAQPLELDADADPDFQKAVAERAANLNKELEQLPKDSVFKGEFEQIAKDAPLPVQMVKQASEDPGISAVALDRAVKKVELIVTYLRHRIGVTDTEIRGRMEERHKTFVGLLQVSNVTAIVAAESLLQEIRDDVYHQDLTAALKELKARIIVDPSQVCERIPLQFSIRFNDPKFDRAAAARAECQCRWEFGDQMFEQAWEVMHYYKSKGSSHVTPEIVKATFTDRGEPVLDADGKTPVALNTQVTVKPARNRLWFGERTVVEAFKLAAALMIAVFGLVAGARDEIAKLDILSGIIAVFLIGFGADTIKSLLSSSKS
jgi:hypothetical protein